MNSPVIIFVYNRADHFTQTYKALSSCPEAKESDLFIFSDGAKNETSLSAVLECRSVVHSVENNCDFKSVTVIESPVNRGLAASVIYGVTEIINKYGRVIVIEDDCVASPYLLSYMNKCLDFFQDDKTIGAVAGYTPELNFPNGFNDDIFTSYRSCSCTWATWADRWQNIDWELNNISDFYNNPALIKKLNYNGADRFIRLYRQTKGNGQSWSVRFGAHLVRNNMLTVYPKYSYIRNIGCDESGVHSRSEDAEKMSVDLSKAIPEPEIKSVEINNKIQKIMKKHYSGGFVSDCKRTLGTAVIVIKERLK